jgi:plasmid stabilization system protein ParE
MKIVLHRLADRELSEAFWYYEGQSDGLGIEFLNEFQRSSRKLLAFPQSAPIIRRIGGVTVRKKVLRRFPYDLFYTCDEDFLSILAIGHQKQRPGYWIGRVRDSDE